MIPRTIHHVWVGSKLPDAQRRHVDTWRQTNPDFELVLWNEDNVDLSLPVLRDAYDRRLWAKVADIVRLKVLAEHGGFYLDVDFTLYRPLVPLLHHTCVLGFQDKDASADWVANGMMAAEPGHWFIRLALERLLAMRQMPFGLDRPTKYGPKLITRLLVEVGLDRYSDDGVHLGDIYVCPARFFFPWTFGEEFRPDCVTADTYGMHLWEKSWEKDVPAWVRRAKLLRHLAISTLRPSAR
ncbi:MAG TPA: glycosyltransferase [Acetobacteraceae bacterium]